LSDKGTYPYFFRVCPSDALQGQVWISIIKHFGWEAVGIISTNDAYGLGGGGVVSNAASDYGTLLFFPLLLPSF